MKANETIDIFNFLATTPANIDFAKKHGRASMIGLPTPQSEECECCGNMVQKNPILFQHPFAYYDILGKGVKKYFFLLGLQILLQLTIAVLFGLPSLMLRYFYPVAQSNPLGVIGFSASRQIFANQVQSYASLLSVVVCQLTYIVIILRLTVLQVNKFLYLQQKQRAVDQTGQVGKTLLCRKINIRPKTSEVDFMLLFKMPTTQFKDIQIYRSLQQMMGSLDQRTKQKLPQLFVTSFPIISIQRIYNQYELKRLLDYLFQCQTLMAGITKNQQTLKVFLQKNITICQKYIQLYKKNLRRLTKYCAVKFKYTSQKNLLIELVRAGNALKLADQQIEIMALPSTEVDWASIGKLRKYKNINQFYIIAKCFLVVLLLLTINFGLVAVFQLFARGISAYLIVIYSLVVALQNQYIEYKVGSQVDQQDGYTVQQGWLTNLAKSVTLRTTFTTVSLVCPYFVFDDSPFTKTGIQEGIMFYFAFILLESICCFIRPAYFIKLASQASAQKQKGAGLTQREANVLYEGVQLDVRRRVSSALTQFMVGCIFGPFYPIVTFFNFLSISFFLCSQKFNFGLIYKEPKPFQSKFIDKSAGFYQYGFVLHAASSFIVRYPTFMRGGATFFTLFAEIAALLLTLLILIIPLNILAKLVPSQLAVKSEFDMGVQYQTVQFRCRFGEQQPFSNVEKKIQLIKKQKRYQVPMQYQNVDVKIISILDQFQRKLQLNQQDDRPAQTPREFEGLRFMEESSAQPLLNRITFNMKRMDLLQDPPTHSRRLMKDRRRAIQQLDEQQD